MEICPLSGAFGTAAEKNWMLNQPPRITADIPLHRAEGPPELLSLDRCRALLAAIRNERPFGELADDTVWKRHTGGGQNPLAQAVAARDAVRLHGILATLHRNFTMEGFDQHRRHTETLEQGPQQRTFHARVVYATLLQCAAALGAVRVWNPEQTDNYPYLAEDQTAAIVTGIRAGLGLTAPFPRTVEGAWGLATASGLVTHRHAISLGYLRQYREHLAVTGRSYAHLVEIGGGIGRIACSIAAERRVPYAIIDLPMVGIVQYAFLTANGIDCALWPETLSTVPGHVDIVSAFDPGLVRALRGALWMNFDGLVEMSAATVERYFGMIADSGADLLSVNHEAARLMLGQARQNWDIGKITAKGLRALPRTLFWERTGYVAQSFLSPGLHA